MNPLVKKEIRLLLPSWLAVLLLEILLPWFGNDPDASFAWTPVFVFFGMIMLAVDPLGREFSLGTFQSLLSQPMERRRIWRTKMAVLIFAATLIFAAYFLSCDVLFHQALKVRIWSVNPAIIESDFRNAILASGMVMLIAMAGGLWTTLLFRQVAAAFWITFLAPAGLLMLIFLFLPSKLASNEAVFIPLLYGTGVLYSAAGFWFAHRLFHRAQDAAWTGGVVALSRWRYYEAGSESSVSTRRWKPFRALVKKELQLQSISWFCAAALLALHVAVIVMRKIHGSFERDSLAGMASEFYWALWLIMPVIIGGTMVAEERRLGLAEGQFSLAASRRLQFALKFFPTLVFGILLGGFMPLLLEGFAAYIGAPNPDFNFSTFEYQFDPVIFICFLAPGLSFAGFFASTLAKNFLQALGAAVVIIVGCVLFTNFAAQLHSFLGIAWNPTLTITMTILTMLIVVPWLAYRNFNYFQESGRVWRRNVSGLTFAILFIFVSSAALYNRAWEVFMPAEPAHGPARFSLAHRPTVKSGANGNLLVRLPDGRVWFDCIGNPATSMAKSLWWAIVPPFPISTGPQSFMDGSNWVSVAGQNIDRWVQSTLGSQQWDQHVFGYTESVGIQSDGTLWISEKADPKIWTGDKLTRFGEGTNWQKVVQYWGFDSVLLLKKDGTLWYLGTNNFAWRDWPQNWPGLRSFAPYQIGTNSDWCEIAADWGYLAEKTNGSVWWIERNNKNIKEQFRRDTNYDKALLKTISVANYNSLTAWIGGDGTLWNLDLRESHERGQYYEVDQVSQDTNWISVALTWDMMIALKSDGTLWQWDYSWTGSVSGRHFESPPKRLGIHNDWIAVASAQATSQGGLLSLAADGSLWFWPSGENYDYRHPLIKVPKQPKLLCNIFSAPD